MIKTIPRKISVAPTKSIIPKYDDVPIITIPLTTDITIETLYFCINFTVHKIVKYIDKPVTIITIHCQRFGTIVCVAGKNIGIQMLLKNIN
jgi:hypothetical protein